VEGGVKKKEGKTKRKTIFTQFIIVIIGIFTASVRLIYHAVYVENEILIAATINYI
jgi:hypothetical protein